MSAIHWSQSKVDEQYPLYEPIVAWQTVKFNPLGSTIVLNLFKIGIESVFCL